MTESESLYASWNPWHGCTKLSPGCKYCYVYRQDRMYGSEISSSQCRLTDNFELPAKKQRNGSYKIPEGKIILTCFTSDFLLRDADEWRPRCFEIIRERNDCSFMFFTKRIDRLTECLPSDWGDGYDNVIIGCTVENQEMANYRLPIFRTMPIKHKLIIAAPLLSSIDISGFLDNSIEEVSAGGESGAYARPCNYDWILDIRRQCMEKHVPFQFHQTGAHFIKNGKMYNIKRRHQLSQAKKAGIDYMIGNDLIPDAEQCKKTL